MEAMIKQINEQAAAEGKGAFQFEDDPARSRNFGVGRRRCSG